MLDGHDFFLNPLPDWLPWLGAGLLVWGLSVVAAWFLARRRLLKEWAREERLALELPSGLAAARPEDREALEIISAYRRRFLTHPWPKTQLRLALITETAQSLLKDIARTYYPQEERPELKASLSDLVGLVDRVGGRLQLWLDTLPVRPLKDVEVGTLLKMHDLYRQVKEHPFYQFLKRHHLDKVASWLWTAKNLLNPWYWSRRAAYAGSRELFVRLFLCQMVSLVGEEAIRIYGRRHPHRVLKNRLCLALQELLHLSRHNGGLPASGQRSLLQFLLTVRGLEDRERLELLAQVVASRVPEPPDPATLAEGERRRVAALLRNLARRCLPPGEREAFMAQIRRRWLAS